MATKSTKNKVSSVKNDLILAPDFNPKDPDLKYTGSEPLYALQPDSDRRKMAMVLSFNWYGRYCQYKDAKQFLVKWATDFGHTERLRELNRADEREIRCSVAWLARMSLRGFALTESEINIVVDEINRVADTVLTPVTKTSNTSIKTKSEETVDEVRRPNVQDIMRERAREVAGEIEGWLDEFIEAGAKTVSVNPVSPLTEKNILPQHVSILTDIWKRHMAEYQAVLDGDDRQLTEAYSHFTKTQLKSLIKFCEAILAGLGSYVSIKKSTKTVRKRKPQSADKIANKLKYQKSYEDTVTKLKLTSVAPAKIIGATEVWAYDTAKRKLHYYIADTHIGTLGIKGTTILGFDSTNSGIKTIRKPEVVIRELVGAGKPASRKIFKDIKSVQVKPNGRTNESLIILKVS